MNSDAFLTLLYSRSMRFHLFHELSVFFLKPGGLVDVSFFGDLVEDYSFPFDVSVWHVAAECPSVFGAELVVGGELGMLS